jgi:hypothetical protein
MKAMVRVNNGHSVFSPRVASSTKEPIHFDWLTFLGITSIMMMRVLTIGRTTGAVVLDGLQHTLASRT